MKALLLNNRISFRAPEPEDLDLFYLWENDSSLWKYGSTIAPISRFELRNYLKQAGEDLYTTHQLRLIVETRKDSIPIGTIDLFDFEPYHNRAFIGMMIGSNYQGKGYGKETVELFIDYCFSHLHLHQLCVHIPISNIPCYNLFTKMGFSLCGILKEWIKRDDQFEDVYFMQKINILK